MAEGSQKIGLLKSTVLSTVNGNTPCFNTHSPDVTPKFKISRGTQANAIPMQKIQKNVANFSPSPPIVPAKPASLCKQPRSPAPPVPPKPANRKKWDLSDMNIDGALDRHKVIVEHSQVPTKKSPIKPAVAPKPALPPKPLVSPIRPQRVRGEQILHTNNQDYISEKSAPKYQERVPASSAHLVVKQSRKSASLGRLEGVHCRAMLVNETNERCLQRDSGFISCSLENVGQTTQKLIGQHPSIPVIISSFPIAPPRRRRKSADNNEPIYAVIDFSKKRNRRLLPTQVQSNGEKLEQPIVEKTPTKDSKASSMTVEQNEPKLSCDSTAYDGEDSLTGSSVLEVSALNATISSKMDSDIEMIENSFATIASLIEDINHTADSIHTSRPLLAKEAEAFLEDSNSSMGSQLEEEIYGIGQTVIARLVFGGTVVEKADLLPVVHQADNRKKRKEFGTALKDVMSSSSTGLELLIDTIPVHERKNSQREPSPSPSSSSSASSSDSKEPDIFSGKHFDPDVISCGSLGDVDTSDATRQNSVDDEVETSQSDRCVGAANLTGDRKERRNSFGLRRTFDTLFISLSSKSGVRKAAEKRKTLDLDSSSTDTDNVVSPRPHVFISRPAPPLPSHKFNRGDRAYRSVQPPEKGRSNSVDGSLAPLDRRHVSLSPVISSPESLTAQQSQLLSIDQSTSSSPVPTHYSNETGSCTSLMEQGSDRIQACSPERLSLNFEKDMLYHSLDGKERKAYMTAKEIASSERVFVDCLKLICIDFRAAVKKASIGTNGRDALPPIIPENELNKVLNYLPQLQNLNHELLNDFELRLQNWSTQPKIADVIVRKGPFLKLYSAYIRDFQCQSAQLEECVQKYPRFAKVLKQFEQSERCKSLSLKHYMLKPVQRLPQYRLLLEVYLRHLNETSTDYNDTLVALKVVTDVAEHANNSMKQEDNFQKIIHLQSRLGNCEIIKPGRFIIKEGELDKVSRKMLQPRYFILLNDCLLYTSYLSSPSSSCGLKLHHELPLTRMEVHLPAVSATEENANEFNVISTARSFTLAASSMQARNEWMGVLSKAISELQSKQLTFPTKMVVESSEFRMRLGQQAPVWIPDSRVTMCQLCTAAFSITFRRHHCRACGKVVCRSCSSQKAGLEYLKFRSARVCDDCFDAINEHEGSVIEEGMDSSNCSSLIETDLSASLVNVPPVCLVHAFNDEIINKRPSSDPVSQSTSQAGFRAQHARRDFRKERRYIPPRLMEVPANDAESQISGYLSRRIRRSWKKNWFVLKDKVLYIYKAPEDVVALDTIPVLGYEVQTFGQEVMEENEQNEFQLFHPKQLPIVFQAENAVLTKKWVEALSSATIL